VAGEDTRQLVTALADALTESTVANEVRAGIAGT
jgi:hypothetical protein